MAARCAPLRPRRAHAWVSRVASSAPPVLLLPQHAGAAQRAKGGRMRFHDKVALIPAAASGIGRATADIVAQEGGIVVAADNHEERLDGTVAQLNEAGGRAHRRVWRALAENDQQGGGGAR